MIYLEYIERDRHITVEAFRYMGATSASPWVDPAADKMILQLGRTLRSGPMPSYLAFWKIAGLERLDAWEVYFGSKDWFDNVRSQAMHRTIHIQRAGHYDELIEGAQAGEGVHVVEFFDADDTVSDAALREAWSGRAHRHDAGASTWCCAASASGGPRQCRPVDLPQLRSNGRAAARRQGRRGHRHRHRRHLPPVGRGDSMTEYRPSGSAWSGR